MTSISILLICSVIVQFIVERLKPLIPERLRKKAIPYITLSVGVAIAIFTQIGLFQTIGITLKYSIADYIITGIAYSGGSAGFNELIKLISESRSSNKISDKE